MYFITLNDIDLIMYAVTDQWRASVGVRDSESCWFTEEIGTYMRCWESPSSNNKTLNARLLARVITGCHYT